MAKINSLVQSLQGPKSMELSFKINKPSEVVFEYLTDMEKFVGVHPVINKIVRLSENHYLIHETLKLGFIPYSFTYPVTIEHSYNDKTVVMHAKVMGFTRIKMLFKLTAESHCTEIAEKITFNSSLPIKTLLKRTFKKHHAQLFQNIENQLP
jgi:carbon monoxide dehydrogenase subunit G